MIDQHESTKRVRIGELMYSGRIRTSCFTSDSYRIIQTMCGLSLPAVVCRRARDLFMFLCLFAD